MQIKDDEWTPYARMNGCIDLTIMTVGKAPGAVMTPKVIGMNWLGESGLPRCFDEDALAYLCKLW